MVLSQIEISINNTSETKLILQLRLRNQTNETLLLRPTIDDWIVDNNLTISLISKLSPPFITLHPQGEAIQKIALQLPSNLRNRQTLRSWLRFPGIHETAIPIQIQIASPEENKNHFKIVDLQLTFPLNFDFDYSSSTNFNSTTEGIFWLIPILTDLDKIPSRWLAAELLVQLCKQGSEYSKTVSGYQLLTVLQPTSFFKNGVSAFSSIQLPQWISETLLMEKQILGSTTPKENNLLYIWESWLLSLADRDIEVNKKTQVKTSHSFLLVDFVNELGMDIDRWFAYFLFGLAQISSTTTAILRKVITETSSFNLQSSKIDEATSRSIVELTSLNTLPVRWLVVELFILMAQKGENYAKTESGFKLLSQLSCTRFFKNGVLTLAYAKVPRWLHISQMAASAYHASLGNSYTQGGLIYTGEQWLRTLIPGIINLDDSKHPASINMMEAFVQKLGMDSDRWFAYGILGLSQVSPRIAAIVQEIANKAPKQPQKKPSPQFKIDDVLGERNTLQR